jgi:hypothetical protein
MPLNLFKKKFSHLAVVERGPGNGGLEPVLAAGRLAVRNLPEAVDISPLRHTGIGFRS